MNRDLINRAIRKAAQSICKFRIAALGLNKDGICVMARTNRPMFARKGGGIHAEEQILAVAKTKGIVRILICRIGRGGDILPIEPCSRCQSIADKLGVEIDSIQTASLPADRNR